MYLVELLCCSRVDRRDLQGRALAGVGLVEAHGVAPLGYGVFWPSARLSAYRLPGCGLDLGGTTAASGLG